jgi:hypothetical protein
MIALACAITSGEAYRRFAEPGVRRAAEPDSEIYAYAAVQPIARTYNLILDAAAGRDDLEALVLVHPHTEIVDPNLCAKVRAALADADVGAVGASGATGVRGIAWWDGAVVSAPVTHAYGEHGSGELPAYSWTERTPPPAAVDCLDGQLLAISPWAVRNLRFDETLTLNYGFDLDFSLQVRASGRKLMVANLRLVHHRPLQLVENLELWVEGHIRLAEKWDSVLNGDVPDEAAWKRRARRAEAEREAARAIAFSGELKLDARVLELERELEEKLDSVSWRLTAPLRAANRLRRGLRDGRRRAPDADAGTNADAAADAVAAAADKVKLRW